jgi:transcriptional regulator NrdR family protein
VFADNVLRREGISSCWERSDMEIDFSGVESLLRDICQKLDAIRDELISSNQCAEQILERLYDIEEEIKKNTPNTEYP